MNVLAKCPKCDAGLPIDAADAPDVIKCGRCGRTIPLHVTPALREDRAVDRCPVCDGAFCEGYDPRLKLERTQTIMQGASHCDFRYRYEK